MMNISPIVNSVKCTVFSRFAQFSHGLEGSTAYYLHRHTVLYVAKVILFKSHNIYSYRISRDKVMVTPLCSFKIKMLYSIYSK